MASLEPREIGRRIAQARDRKGWTQLSFALEANVSPSTIQRWEAGKLPPVRELMRIADLLGVDPDELVDPGPSDQEQEGIDSLRAEVAATREMVEAILAHLGVDVPEAMPPLEPASRGRRAAKR